MFSAEVLTVCDLQQELDLLCAEAGQSAPGGQMVRVYAEAVAFATNT
jgi:hypothetical protein